MSLRRKKERIEAVGVGRKMEKKDEGNLADIFIRASGASNSNNNNNNHHQELELAVDWEIPPSSDRVVDDFASTDNFGDPFSSIQDPLLHDLHLDLTDSTFFLDTASSSSSSTSHPAAHHMALVLEEDPQQQNINNTGSSSSSSSSVSLGLNGATLLAQTIFNQEMRSSNNSNIFTRMLQISPPQPNNNNNPKFPISPPPTTMQGSDGGPSVPLKLKNTSLVSSANHHEMINHQQGDHSSMTQISSPRNPGIKRRKSQAKKVVCIPAPSAANGRPGGEVVPSDLWAWRKYGQKPIKGSPYPRGYYRCSSSKGCSARKQVERSRTDPNMLVITYTSEHNHPWPTQRNALAGSTRSQPPKTADNSASKTSLSKITNMEDHKDKISAGCSSVKEEGMVTEKATDHSSTAGEKDHHSGGGSFQHNNLYRPEIVANNKSNHSSDDFFADLGELEPSNLFTQGLRSEEEMRDNNNKVALDPFNFFYWAGNSSS